MDIPLSQRLSFKQTCLAVLLALSLGGVLGLTWVAHDYAIARDTLNLQAHTLLEVTAAPAGHALRTQNNQLAGELVQGLLQPPAVTGAELRDSSGAPLAIASRSVAEGGWARRLSDQLFGSELHLDLPADNGLGSQHLSIDTWPHGQRFLQRAILALGAGLTGSLLLSLALLGLFHLLVTRPLGSLAAAIVDRDPQRASPPLPCPSGHRRDEIGALVQACNQQLARLDSEIAQRRAAEEHLMRALGELESRVVERTAELEQANRQLLTSNHELQLAQSTAQETAQARAHFLASMSHEIRTPLNGMLGMLELALDGTLSPQLRQQLDIARDSGRSLIELLNGVLDLSRFEAGQLDLETIPFDLSSLVEDIASQLGQNAAPGVELTCLIAPDLPGEVVGDPLRVRQIVSNLLSNALKFTRHGRVDLRLSGTTDGVLLEVRDTGIGIAPEALARIFQPFAQAEAGISRQFGGSGLGLSLTQRLCEAMRGTLEVDSKPGLGSRFRVRLPLHGHAPATPLPALHGRVIALCSARSGLSELLASWLPVWGIDYQRRDTDASLAGIEVDLLISDCPECLYGHRPQALTPILLTCPYGDFLPEGEARALQPLQQLPRPLTRAALYQALQRVLDQSPTSEPPPKASPRAPRILLVEDNPVNQLVVKGLLGYLGLDATMARQGEQALKLLAQEDFDLILMDCNMPLLDGYETTRRLRRDARLAHLPVIALTANALPEERERCLQAGMNDYLSKPLRREELKTMLQRWLPHGLQPA